MLKDIRAAFGSSKISAENFGKMRKTKYRKQNTGGIIMKRSTAFFLSLVTSASLLMSGCPAVFAEESTTEVTSEAGTEAAVEASEDSTEATTGEVLEDGVYTAEFDTDSSMFHVNEANDGKGVLTVKDGKMTIHVSLSGKGFLNLFVGTSEDAKKDGAELLEPTTDTVTYKDGMSEEVYGFDIPVPAIGEEFTVAAIGKKGKWYDHKVSVKNPVKDENAQADEGEKVTAEELGLEDGEYTADVTLEGGSGRATVDSPANLVVKDGEVTATIVWSSPNYDYMLVGGEKYEPVNTEGNSTFEIPVDGFDYPMEVVADTVAMSEPHEIEYTLTFNLNK